MRRRLNGCISNSTQTVLPPQELDAATEIKALKAEIRALKGRIARLEARSADQDQVPESLRPTTEQPPVKRGPRPKHSLWMYRDRDRFVQFLQQHWPEIEPLCGPKPNMHAWRMLLEAFPIHSFGHEGATAERLLDRVGFIEEFLTNKRMRERFHNDPRVLAGALAGVPGVGLWRSLKLCPPSSCKFLVRERAMRSYIQRKHPTLHEALLAGMNLPQLIAWMKEYRTRDKVLRCVPPSVLIGDWNNGVADYLRLGTKVQPAS